jgi:hypothetical protein
VARKRLRHLFPKLPKQPGFWKRRTRLTDTIEWLMAIFAKDSPDTATRSSCWTQPRSSAVGR